MKPSEKQLAIARHEGGHAAFNRPAGMAMNVLLKLCPYQNHALALAWRTSVRRYFNAQHGWQPSPTSTTPAVKPSWLPED